VLHQSSQAWLPGYSQMFSSSSCTQLRRNSSWCYVKIMVQAMCRHQHCACQDQAAVKHHHSSCNADVHWCVVHHSLCCKSVEALTVSE